MAKPKDVLLRDFLTKSNLAVPKSPPWVHSTASAKLIAILEQEKLLAVKCNVFKGEKLCYLFVGRAAYKGKDAVNPESWQLIVNCFDRIQELGCIMNGEDRKNGAMMDGRFQVGEGQVKWYRDYLES